MTPAQTRFRIPLRVPFRGVRVREGVLVEGPEGWGECSPFPGFGSSDVEPWMAAAVESAARPFPAPVRDSVPVHVTVPAVGPDEAAAIVRASGCTSAKVKVAEGDDEARIEAVRDALGPSGRIRIDANGAWDVEMAVRRIRALSRFGLELVEQPVSSIEEMAELRARTDVPLAADECVRTLEDARRISTTGAADALVLKAQPLGGVWAALLIAEEAGMPAIVSSPLETSVGLSASLALAAALPELPYACGLATLSLLEGDVVADPLLPRDGAITVRRPAVDRELLKRYEVTDA